MKSSNPSLREKTFRAPESAFADGTMTMTGAINKTGFLFLLLVASGAYSWSAPSDMNMLIGSLGGFVAALVLIFNPQWAAFLAPAYAVLEGLFIGTLSISMEKSYPGIASNAMTLTFGVLGVMLVVYRAGLLRATPTFVKVLSFSMMAILVTYLVDIVMSFFGHNIAMIHEGSPIGIAFSVVVVGVASLNLILDFAVFEQNADRSPKYMEWYCGFSLMVTLVWLYLEILRLLSKLSKK